jgi:signal transduction histidine kinase
MLTRNFSLTVRAALIFLSFYLLLFGAVLLQMSVASLGSDGDGHHSGPSVALSFAAADLERAGAAPAFRAGGRFARLAARNPSLWLLGEVRGRRFSFGPVPVEAERLFRSHAGVLDRGRFRVPGIASPLADAAVQQRDTAIGPALIAAGGVAPHTLSLADSFIFFVGEALLPILLLGAIGVGATLVALPLLTRGLKRVAASAGAIGPNFPDRRLEERRVPREVLPLVRAFNAALDRLSDELGRRKRFIADVAHELRTPLAVASLQVDSLPDDERKQALQRVLTRTSHLMAQMLDVERLSAAGVPQVEIDLTALARDVVADLAPMAMAAGHELSLDAPEAPVLVKGDPHSLGRAISNLIGNALAHGGGRGIVQVIVTSGRTLDVADEGPGVPTALRPALFEPFCREPKDRDGCGLGLHLTREIMRAHGGDACLVESAKGARFRLEFP